MKHELCKFCRSQRVLMSVQSLSRDNRACKACHVTIERAKLVTWQSSGRSLSRDNPSRRQGARNRAVGLHRGGSDLDTDRMNTALFIKSSIMWVGTVLLTLCECVPVVSSITFFQQPQSVCSSSLSLWQSVGAVVSYHARTHTNKQNKNLSIYFLFPFLGFV